MRIPNTLERLRRAFEADKGRTILISTVGRYAITESEDLYFRCLYAAIKLRYIKPMIG